MQQMQQQQSLHTFPQFIELQELRYWVARTKLEKPQPQSYNPTLEIPLFTAKLLVQRLNEELFNDRDILFIPTSNDWTDIHQGLMKTAEGISLMRDYRESLDSGCQEIVDSLLVFPNPVTRTYFQNVDPPLDPSGYPHPYLIERAKIEFNPESGYLLRNRGIVSPLNIPQDAIQLVKVRDYTEDVVRGTDPILKKDIPELGLLKGTEFNFSSHRNQQELSKIYGHEQGLRAITRGGYPRKGTGRESASAYSSPLNSTLTGLRLCARSLPILRDQQRYSAIISEFFK